VRCEALLTAANEVCTDKEEFSERHCDAVCFIPTPLFDYLFDYERTSAVFPAGQIISSSVLLYTVFLATQSIMR